MSERSAPRSLAPALAASAVLAACAWSCGTTDVPVFSLTQGAQGAPGTDGGLPDTSLAEDAAPVPQDQQAFCNGTGPPELLDKTDGGTVVTCPDQLAQREFRYALCTCSSYVSESDSQLFTDAFDGSKGAYDASSAVAGGSVGVNGDLHPSGPLNIGGSLWASNSTVITTSSVYVAGELHTQGEMRPATDTAVMADALDVEGDAWMAGGLQTTGSVTIKGTLHVPAGQPTVTGTFNHGATDTQSLMPQPACDCTPEHLVDVAGIVATYAANNDDDNLKIRSDDLENVQTDQTVVLGCGRAFYTHIGASQAAIDLKVQGHVALFVQDYILAGDLIIEVPTGSELDLFVGGNVTVSGNFMLGDVSNPARARMYVGGTIVNLANAATIAGNLYAPQASLTLGASAPTTLFGALFVSQLNASANLFIHYDESILNPSSTRACSTPASCTSSCDCDGLACNSGTCGLCSENIQCCAPLLCGPQGTCVAGVTPR
jgi:hypothetical protein